MHKINKHITSCTTQETEPIFYNNFKWSIIYKNFESPCYIPETCIILYISYASILKNITLRFYRSSGLHMSLVLWAFAIENKSPRFCIPSTFWNMKSSELLVLRICLYSLPTFSFSLET